MTYKYNSVFVKETSTIGGIYEKDGPLKKYFDKIYDEDLYYGEKSFEKAEIKIHSDAVKLLLKKSKCKDEDIDILIAGDLQNQIASSDYMARNFNIPFLGIYNACATSSEGIIIGSSLIDGHKVNNVIVSTSSHNTAAEKQFRNPTEYGTPKPKTSTFTATGGVAILLTNKNTSVKIESSTIGKVIDLKQKDVNHMGAVMAPAAADTLYRHLTDLKRSPDYYDLILTGDLGIYGKKIFKEYLKKQYNIELKDNYNDCGVMLYDLEKQAVLAGGSGPVCSGLVNFSYVYKNLKSGNLKKVLIIPTGALFSPTMFFQKESIPAIAHAVSLESDL